MSVLFFLIDVIEELLKVLEKYFTKIYLIPFG